MFQSSTMEVQAENESGYLGIILGPCRNYRLLALYKNIRFVKCK